MKRKYSYKEEGLSARYLAELRYFDEMDDDYIHLSFSGRTRASAFRKALQYHHKHFGFDKAKIDVFDNQHPEHGVWCVESEIIPAK